MAGTVTVEEVSFHGISKIKWSWTCTAAGAADLATTFSYYGEVLALLTDPDGTDVPTLNYDITVTDPDGYDVMQAAAANRSDTATQQVVPTAKSIAVGKLTLNVTNAGNAKKGVAILYIHGSRV